MSDEVENAIKDNAVGPASASGDAGGVQQHKLTDQIAADKYIASKDAAQGKKLGVRLVKILPPGSV